MLHYVILTLFLTFLLLPSAVTAQMDKIKWFDLDASMDCARKSGKKIIVLIYTEWDGWSTLLEQRTFHDPNVVAYLNEHFCPAKIDALSKEEIWFRGYRFPYLKEQNVNQLAYQLLDGRLKYPSLVFMNRSTEVISPVHGYLEPRLMLKLLKFFHEDKYKEMTWEEYAGHR